MYCTSCGKEILDEAVICPYCGCAVNNKNISGKSKAPVSNHTQQNKTQTSLILGIIGIISAWIFALVGHIVSIIGIVFGVKEYKETGVITGLILSIIGESCAILSSLIGMAML